MPCYGYFVLTATYLPQNKDYLFDGFPTVASYQDAIQTIISATHTNAKDWKFHVDVEA